MATKANLVIDQGTTYSTSINITNEQDEIIDLTGSTGSAQIRKHYTSSNAVSFSVTIDANNGIVTLGLSANQTGAMTAGRYVYDVEMTDSANVVSRILEGIVTVTPQATR